ncbi:hypothetical protein C8R45DRAFT_1101241 [Mycena sanguinolenta]|nr:hypothetical protein C8R45DRAFT_1101241 [Mycena sanguinolenta]
MSGHYKSTCNYLKVVNKQDKKKFKNMAITGTVNCQCSHVFILASVDLPHAERFANADYALAMAMRNHKPSEEFAFKLRIEIDDVDEVATYDIACEYVARLAERFEKYFPDQLEAIKKMRWGVPALHVQGHQDSCTYLFGTAYMECIGHFHGETAEHYWPEANQLGPHVRQMNLGHRQDTIINHHGDWNHKKTMHIAADLAEDLQDAKHKYIEKRNHFVALSISFKDLVPTWKKMPRVSEKVGKEAVSMYKHSTTKESDLCENFSSTMIPKNRIARFLECGLKIQGAQRKLRHLIKNTAEHELQLRKKEISLRTAKLRDQIATFRQDQKDLMPKVGDKVAIQTTAAPAVEDECLYLPSDFTAAERQHLDLGWLGAEEARWREGEVFDTLRALQHVVKAVTALRNRKTKNERQQKQNTRTGDQIRDVLTRQSHHMESYDASRTAIISLNGFSDFPVLTEAMETESTTLISELVDRKRHVGDSKRTDGLLFRATALSIASSHDEDGDVIMSGLSTGGEKESDNEVLPHVGTQMDKRKSGSKPKKQITKEKQPPVQSEGWLWQLGKLAKMSDVEMEAWASEGDRVQWFRAETEMQRWQEQIEQKLAELLRTYRSFTKMQAVWLELAASAVQHGAAAYARQKAAMYMRRASEADVRLCYARAQLRPPPSISVQLRSSEIPSPSLDASVVLPTRVHILADASGLTIDACPRGFYAMMIY